MTRTYKWIAASALALRPPTGMATAQDVAREDTVIFDLDRTIKDPENFNWFTPGTKRMHGAHQTMWEPLFILNYATGNLDPWLATGFEQNDASTEFTISLREGVEWSDGEAFNADDVVFTVDMAMNNEEISSREASTIRSQVASVEKVDDLTVKFTLNKRKPALHRRKLRRADLRLVPDHARACLERSKTRRPSPSTRRSARGPTRSPAPRPAGRSGIATMTGGARRRASWICPNRKRVVFLESGGEESRAQLMATNQMDAAQNVSVGTYRGHSGAKPQRDCLVHGLSLCRGRPCARQLEINTTIAPWDNANMRKAVATDHRPHADRERGGRRLDRAVQDDVRAIRLDGSVHQRHRSGRVRLPETGDADAGKAMIEAEGWAMGSDGVYEKDGEELSVDIHVNSASTEYTRTIDVIVEQLNRAGIKAKAVPVENGVFWGEVLPFGAYEMSYSWLSCGSVNEPWASMGRYTVKDVVPVGERSAPASTTPPAGTARVLREVLDDRGCDGRQGAGRSRSARHGGRGLSVP